MHPILHAWKAWKEEVEVIIWLLSGAIDVRLAHPALRRVNPCRCSSAEFDPKGAIARSAEWKAVARWIIEDYSELSKVLILRDGR